MIASLMKRAAYAHTLSALVLMAAIVGCTTSHKPITTNHPVGPNEFVNYSMWEEFSRTPAAVDEENVKSRVIKETINVQAENIKSKKVVGAKACGDLIQGESSHTALNNEDAEYYLRVDCQSVIGEAGKDKTTWVRITKSSTVPQQRSYLTRWRRKAALDNLATGGERRAVPYVCFRGQVTSAICDSSAASTAKYVQNFTSRVDVYKKW